MADQKITDFTALTGAGTAVGDLIELVDVSDTTMHATGTNKKQTIAEAGIGLVTSGGLAPAASPTFTGTATAAALVATGTFKHGTTADAFAVKGTYLTGVIAVAVPAISGTAVLPSDSAVTDISADPLTFAAAVGDAVVAIPQEALEADCLLCNAYVVGADSIEVVFAAKEGGDGVSSANKNFKFLIIDLT